MSKLAATILSLFVFVFVANANAQEASPSPSPSPDSSPSPSASPSPTTSPSPSPSTSPSPSASPATGGNEKDKVLGASTTLGDTGTQIEIVKWVIASVLGFGVLFAGFRLVKSNDKE